MFRQDEELVRTSGLRGEGDGVITIPVVLHLSIHNCSIMVLNLHTTMWIPCPLLRSCSQPLQQTYSPPWLLMWMSMCLKSGDGDKYRGQTLGFIKLRHYKYKINTIITGNISRMDLVNLFERAYDKPGTVACTCNRSDPTGLDPADAWEGRGSSRSRCLFAERGAPGQGRTALHRHLCRPHSVVITPVHHMCGPS